MQVKQLRFVNTIFTSNTYVLYTSENSDVWVVDPGDMTPVWKWMQENGKNRVRGILLTHTHFDHLYGVNSVLEKNPDCLLLVANEYGKNGLTDIKQNGSKYTSEPIVINENADVRFMENDMELWPGVNMKTFLSPGHSDDSICLLVDNFFFTGDTLIENIRTVTKIRGGSVEKLKESVLMIGKLQGYGYHVCPGHNEEFELDGYDLGKATRTSDHFPSL